MAPDIAAFTLLDSGLLGTSQRSSKSGQSVLLHGSFSLLFTHRSYYQRIHIRWYERLAFDSLSLELSTTHYCLSMFDVVHIISGLDCNYHFIPQSCLFHVLSLIVFQAQWMELNST